MQKQVKLSSQNTAAMKDLLQRLLPPDTASHKGQNGKLLVIGGSELFHASIIWSAEVASRIVDMVHVTSPAETNNRLIRERIKRRFLNGIVVPWDRVEAYLQEDDCVLIGPGMSRQEGLEPGELSTSTIVNHLLRTYPNKRWVIDGGALQEVDPHLLTAQCVITPHRKEWERLLTRITNTEYRIKNNEDGITNEEQLVEDAVWVSCQYDNLTILLKGPRDMVVRGDEVVIVEGGNAGMTKGGTGDVLAGLTAALATKNDLFLSAQLASVINKRAGEDLATTQGLFFNASDLVAQIPQTMHELLR